MKKFPIMLVEQFCEIKAHTLRMWEIRHRFMKPKRTDTNLRSYDLDELRQLMNIALLNRNGYKISLLAQRSPLEITQIIERHTSEDVKKQNSVNRLLLSMLEADVDNFVYLLNQLVFRWDIDTVITDIIYPLMQKGFHNKIQLPWWEKVIMEELKIKVIAGIDSIPAAAKGAKIALVLEPVRQCFDLPLLLTRYFAQQQGFRVYYLGSCTPVELIESVIKEKKPQFVITGFKARQNELDEINRYIERHHPVAELLIAGLDKAAKYSASGKEKFIPNKDLPGLFAGHAQMDYADFVEQMA